MCLHVGSGNDRGELLSKKIDSHSKCLIISEFIFYQYDTNRE